MPKLSFHVPILDPDRPADGMPPGKRAHMLLALVLLPLALVLILPFVVLVVCWLYGSVLVNGVYSLLCFWRTPSEDETMPLAKPHFLENPTPAPTVPNKGEARDA